jgi:UDP-N-acetylglucosamine--N-acetylmuramyl-(pentapeptide) pyrophosphoryl-undecaprenol N-acetylglucosamine transferase
MRVAIAAGGTGGHIFPALAVVSALRTASPGVDVRFFGPDNRGERRLVEPSCIPFESVPAAAVLDRGPIALVKAGVRILTGIFAATRKLRRYRPDVVFSTGGYASFPQAIAARLLRKPLLVFLPDVSPGLAVRAESRLATKMATTTEAALQFLPRKKTAVTGYPIRDAFFEMTKERAREQLGLPQDARVVVIAGASQGARAINNAVFPALPALAAEADVFHITGTDGIAAAEEARQALGEGASRYHPAAFRDDLPVFMLAADLAVMRAGASVLGELTAAGLPAILVPLTISGGHQRPNANWLQDHGAAIVLEEPDLGRLGAEVTALLADEARRSRMAAAATSLARPGAAQEIADLIVQAARR